jgi:DNA primase
VRGAFFLGQDNDEAGNKIVEHLIEFVGREVRRILVPQELGKDWTDFWQNGGYIEVFRSLLDEAPVASGTKVVTNFL